MQRGGHILPGDLIETSQNGHIWISLIDGAMIRISPKSTFSIESFEISKEKLIFFHRVNSGNINWISRTEQSESPKSSLETDRVFYPFLDIHQLMSFLNFSSLEKNYSENFHYEKYRYLNFLKKNNGELLTNKTVEHIINTPYLLVDFTNANLEFVVDWTSSDYVKVRESDDNISFYIKNINNLKEINLTKNQWYKINTSGIANENKGDKAWFGDYVIADIPSLKIMNELYISIASKKFFSSNSYTTFWKKYLISSKNIDNRKKYLLEYMNKQGASFVNERAVFLRRNMQKSRFSLKNYLNSYYFHSSYFNRVLSELKIEFRITKGESPLKKILRFNSDINAIFEKIKHRE